MLLSLAHVRAVLATFVSGSEAFMAYWTWLFVTQACIERTAI
jgi:hypothetical protein